MAFNLSQPLILFFWLPPFGQLFSAWIWKTKTLLHGPKCNDRTTWTIWPWDTPDFSVAVDCEVRSGDHVPHLGVLSTQCSLARATCIPYAYSGDFCTNATLGKFTNKLATVLYCKFDQYLDWVQSNLYMLHGAYTFLPVDTTLMLRLDRLNVPLPSQRDPPIHRFLSPTTWYMICLYLWMFLVCGVKWIYAPTHRDLAQLLSSTITTSSSLSTRHDGTVRAALVGHADPTWPASR